MVIPPPQATLTVREYHAALGRWSSSRLKIFREDPGRAFGLWVAEPRIYAPEPPRPGQIIGSAVHALMATAGGHPEVIERVKADSRNSAAWKRAWHAWPDKLVLTRKEHDAAKRAADALLEPRTEAAEIALVMLTSPGYAEWYWTWEEPVAAGEDGEPRWIPCQQLLDGLRLVGNRPAHIELKTCGDSGDVAPDRFKWVARRMGYDDQAAFNLRGLSRRLGQEPLSYLIVIGTRPSYPVSVIRVGEWLLDSTEGRRGRLSARAELDVTLERLAWCLEDASGSRWGHPYELLEDGNIPEL